MNAAKTEKKKLKETLYPPQKNLLKRKKHNITQAKTNPPI